MRLILAGLVLMLAGGASAQVYVAGYLRADGTYVSPHYRSSPDSSTFNNWSSLGNVNPYTGAVGTRTAVYSSAPIYTPAPIQNPVLDSYTINVLDQGENLRNAVLTAYLIRNAQQQSQLQEQATRESSDSKMQERKRYLENLKQLGDNPSSADALDVMSRFPSYRREMEPIYSAALDRERQRERERDGTKPSAASYKIPNFKATPARRRKPWWKIW
jgi:hypothetical protein